MTSVRIRLLFALVAGIIFLALKAVFPDLPFTEESTVAFFGLIAAYLLGEGLEGPRIMDNFKAMLKSWKFRSLLAGVIVLVAQSLWVDFPLNEEQVIQAIEMLSALIVGLGANGAIATFAAARNY